MFQHVFRPSGRIHSTGLILLDCTDAQHTANLALPGVEALTEAQAVKLARKYQPKRTLTQFDPQTGKEEKVTIAAVDLTPFIQNRP